MLTPARLEEVIAWMRLHGVERISGITYDNIHISVADMNRIAPDAKVVRQEKPYPCAHYTATVSNQLLVAVDIDIEAYTAYQNR